MQTKGEFLTEASKNASESASDKIKLKAAELIDLIEEHAQMRAVSSTAQAEQQREVMRCKSTAITNIEQGAMWAVKAVTKSERS